MNGVKCVTKKGQELVAPLEAMLMVARVDLPSVADAFLAANRVVAGTTDHDGALAGRQTQESWCDVRDEFQRILGETAGTMKEVALAFERVVEEYCRTDSEAAAGLEGALAGETYEKRPYVDDPQMPEGARHGR